jgi:hypothetical protein
LSRDLLDGLAFDVRLIADLRRDTIESSDGA